MNRVNNTSPSAG